MGFTLINKSIISILVIVLIALPTFGSAAMIVDSDVSVPKLAMGSMYDVQPERLGPSSQAIGQAEECHQAEKSKCSTEDCGCCVAHVFPVTTSSGTGLSRSHLQHLFDSPAFTDADAKRLIRPPIYI